MSISYNQNGKIVFEPTDGNVLGLTEIVLRHFEKTIRMLEKDHPGLSHAEYRRRAREAIETDIQPLTKVVLESCRKAMEYRPDSLLRQDLVGRILFHRLEAYITQREGEEQKFPRSFIKPVLRTMRTIIGEANYETLNELSARPSLEYCVVHELRGSSISWEEFYQQNLVNILMIRIKNILKRWLEEEPERQALFLETVNTHIKSGGTRSFTEQDFKLLMGSWGVLETEPPELADSPI